MGAVAGAVAWAAIAAVMLTACGESSVPGIDPTTSVTEAVVVGPGAPACSDTWVEGELLPEDYDGCVEGASWVANEGIGCLDGVGVFYVYERSGASTGRLFATTGQIILLSKDEQADGSKLGRARDACIGTMSAG
jgi:hypothetical protein